AQAIADREPDEAASSTIRRRRRRAEEELGRRALMLQQNVGQTLWRLRQEPVSEYSELGHTTVAISVLTSSADLTSLCGLLDASLQLVQDFGRFRAGWRILHIQDTPPGHWVHADIPPSETPRDEQLRPSAPAHVQGAVSFLRPQQPAAAGAQLLSRLAFHGLGVTELRGSTR
ncbi:unnamed protein product, partial [Symbiodinium microadriaticum]